MKRKLIVFALFAISVMAVAQSPNVASLKSKAEAGDMVAQVSLGRAYEKGEGVAQSDDLAAKWYRAAADKGDPQAQSELGVLYRLGRGVPQDKEMAVKWYRMAAKQGFGPAMFNLGTAYYNGDGVPISDSYAYAWFVLAKRAGSNDAEAAVARMESELITDRLVLAKSTLAEIAESGEELPKAAPEFAFEIYRSMTETNVSLVDANLQLGRMYSKGIGVTQDGAKAVTYFNASGTPESLRYLADMYMEGRGIPADPKKGVATLKKLIEFGDDAALKQLAGYYWDGGPVSQNYKLAVKRYAVLAQNADAFALYRLAIASRDGLGTKKNVETACFYFILANTMGSMESLNASRGVCQASTSTKAKERAMKWVQEHLSTVKAAQDRQKELKAQSKATESK